MAKVDILCSTVFAWHPSWLESGVLVEEHTVYEIAWVLHWN